jgi:hypothetical protein
MARRHMSDIAGRLFPASFVGSYPRPSWSRTTCAIAILSRRSRMRSSPKPIRTDCAHRSATRRRLGWIFWRPTRGPGI